MEHSLLLGIDIGGTKSAVLAGTFSGEVLDRVEWASLTERGPEPLLHEVEEHARRLIAVHAGISAVGVSIGGPMDAEQGVILSPPNLPGWNEIPLRTRLEERLGLPVRVEHDAAACAFAEYLWGAARECSRVIYLTCGTGFGAGFVFGGRIYRGALGASPEVGHWRYAEDGPEAFGKRGSVEAFCSGSGLGKLAAWKYPARWGVAPPDGPLLGELAGGGDAQASEILRINATAVGHTAARLADLLRPDCIVLGSLARYLGSDWVENVKAAFSEEALAGVEGAARIVPAGLGERLQDCSALAAACGVL